MKNSLRKIGQHYCIAITEVVSFDVVSLFKIVIVFFF